MFGGNEQYKRFNYNHNIKYKHITYTLQKYLIDNKIHYEITMIIIKWNTIIIK